MKAVLGVTMTMALAACGGGDRLSGDSAPVTRLSTGPISSACMASPRKARSRRLCGCIQTVADRTLRYSDQTLAASLFSDPHRAQEIRQSDRRRHERFWKQYTEFSAAAEKSCG